MVSARLELGQDRVSDLADVGVRQGDDSRESGEDVVGIVDGLVVVVVVVHLIESGDNVADDVVFGGRGRWSRCSPRYSWI